MADGVSKRQAEGTARNNLCNNNAESAQELRNDLRENPAESAGKSRRIPHSNEAEKRTARELELSAKQLALPAKRYGVILADPEWKFERMDRVADDTLSDKPDRHQAPALPHRERRRGEESVTAVELITSSIAVFRSASSTMWLPLRLFF